MTPLPRELRLNPLPANQPGRSNREPACDLSACSDAMSEHLRVFVQMQSELAVLTRIAGSMVRTLLDGGKILLCGNGGSAADAQHLAAELVGRFQLRRRGLAALALTTDSSVLTSIANDFGYDQVFRRQLEALGAPGDLLIGLSTSGSSENVCVAFEEARLQGIGTVAMVGKTGGRLADLAELVLCVPSMQTARVQEAHIFCAHVLCEMVETAMVEVDRVTMRQLDDQGGLPFDHSSSVIPAYIVSAENSASQTEQC